MGKPYFWAGPRRSAPPAPSEIPEAEWSEVEPVKALPPPAGILPAPDDAAVLAALSEMG